MNEGMSEARLVEIRASYPLNDDRPWDAEDAADAFQAVQELLAEVDRIRGVERHPRATIADEVAAIGQDLERDEELKQLRTRLAEIGEIREEWRFWDGKGWFTVSRNPLSAADVQYLRKQTGRPVEHRVAGQWREVPDA